MGCWHFSVLVYGLLFMLLGFKFKLKGSCLHLCNLILFELSRKNPFCFR